MKKQIFISFMIVIFFNFVIGCSVSSTKLIAPVTSFSSQEPIKGLVLTNSKVYLFDKDGGKYHNPTDYIGGKDLNGKNIKLNPQLINEYRTSSFIPINTDNLEGNKIAEMLLTTGKLIIFDNNYGFYNPGTGKIIGTTTDGSIINIGIDKITEYYSNHPQTINFENLDTNTILTQITLQEYNTLHIFDKSGGRYIHKKAKITGVTLDDGFVTVNPDSVQFVKISYVNEERSEVFNWILVGWGVLALAGLFMIYYIATGGQMGR
ncbi:MAG: hypothetical protein V1773_06950 [bacterium]